MQKYKKFLCDIVLNVVATAIPLIALQLVILPLTATRMSDERYGLLLTVLSIFNVVPHSLGNALNNIRLVKNTEYEQSGESGDFNILLLCETLVGTAAVFFAILQYDMGWNHRLLVCGVAVFWLCREYYIVAFLLRLDYKGIVINNIIMACGYFIGAALFWLTGYWELIYGVGIVMSLAYIMLTTAIMREPLKITSKFRRTSIDFLLLAAAALIINLLNYADRLIIYPLIGGAAVSIYYVSTLFGKVVSTAMGPLNSVLLSYLAKRESFGKKLFAEVLMATGCVSVVGYLFCRVIAYPALKIIYPQWADEAIYYVPITTVIAMLAMFISVISPFVLRFCKMKWQLVINIMTLLIYVSASVVLYRGWGLMGFCVGVCFSNLVKLCVMIVLGFQAAIGGKEEAGE